MDDLASLTATSDSTSEVSLSWPTVTGASGYEIDRKDSSGNWDIYDSVDDGSATSYTDSDVSDGTTYTYRVLPYNDSGTSDDSGAPTAPASTELIAPGNVQAVALSSSSVEIVWDDQSSSETGFEVLRSTSSSGNYTEVGTTAAGVTDYVDSSASPGMTYWYEVESTNSAAGQSDPSSSAPVTTPAAPPALTGSLELSATPLDTADGVSNHLNPATNNHFKCRHYGEALICPVGSTASRRWELMDVESAQHGGTSGNPRSGAAELVATSHRC